MPAQIGNGVTLKGFTDQDSIYTWNISGTNGVNPGAGCPMTQDTTADNTAKTCVDGSPILGNLQTYENRVQEGIVCGAIADKGIFTWPYTGATPARGNSVLGSATAGAVRDSGTAGVMIKVVAVDTVALTVDVKMA